MPAPLVLAAIAAAVAMLPARRAVRVNPVQALRDEYTGCRESPDPLRFAPDVASVRGAPSALPILRADHRTGDQECFAPTVSCLPCTVIEIRPVPEISRFLGIVIAMFYRDHDPPHFHATYGKYFPCGRRTPAARAAGGRLLSGVLRYLGMPPTAGVRLSTDLDDPQAIPYFLWDAPMTVAELRLRLAGPERIRLLGKILREARDPDVWRFTTPSEVRQVWPQLQAHLGRRRRFWEFLLARWLDQGLDERT